MPCRSDYTDSELSEGEKRSRPQIALKSELDAVTDMLCRLCHHLESTSTVAYVTMPRDIRAWFNKHKKFDKSEGR